MNMRPDFFETFVAPTLWVIGFVAVGLFASHKHIPDQPLVSSRDEVAIVKNDAQGAQTSATHTFSALLSPRGGADLGKAQASD